jgi:hypothetical protein
MQFGGKGDPPLSPTCRKLLAAFGRCCPWQGRLFRIREEMHPSPAFHTGLFTFNPYRGFPVPTKTAFYKKMSLVVPSPRQKSGCHNAGMTFVVGFLRCACGMTWWGDKEEVLLPQRRFLMLRMRNDVVGRQRRSVVARWGSSAEPVLSAVNGLSE